MKATAAAISNVHVLCFQAEKKSYKPSLVFPEREGHTRTHTYMHTPVWQVSLGIGLSSGDGSRTLGPSRREAGSRLRRTLEPAEPTSAQHKHCTCCIGRPRGRSVEKSQRVLNPAVRLHPPHSPFTHPTVELEASEKKKKRNRNLRWRWPGTSDSKCLPWGRSEVGDSYETSWRCSVTKNGKQMFVN